MAVESLFRDRSGAILVQTLVIGGLVAMAGFFVLQSVRTSQKQYQSLAIKSEFDLLGSELRLIFDDPDTCSLSLGGQDVTGDLVFYGPGSGGSSVTARPGQTFHGWKVETLRLENLSVVSAGPPEIRSGTLRVTISAIGPQTVLEPNWTYPVRIEVSGGKIQRCYGKYSPRYLCEEFRGVYDSSSTPPCTIDRLFAPSCGAGEVLIGFDPNGNRICRKFQGT